VSGQQHAPADLYPREKLGTHFTGGWVGLMTGVWTGGKSRPHRNSIPHRPARSQSPCKRLVLLCSKERSNPHSDCQRTELRCTVHKFLSCMPQFCLWHYRMLDILQSDIYKLDTRGSLQQSTYFSILQCASRPFTINTTVPGNTQTHALSYPNACCPLPFDFL